MIRNVVTDRFSAHTDKYCHRSLAAWQMLSNVAPNMAPAIRQATHTVGIM